MIQLQIIDPKQEMYCLSYMYVLLYVLFIYHALAGDELEAHVVVLSTSYGLIFPPFA